MSEKVRKGSPILFSIMLGIVLTLLISIASAIAMIMEVGDDGIMIAQALAFFIMAVIVSIYMKRKDRSLAAYGFKRLRISKERATLYYIPLLVIAFVQPIMGGLNFELTAAKIVLIVIFSLLVGFTEESIFRGIIREKLQFKSRLFYIVFSSLFFGILHIANAFSGADMMQIVLQIINAFLIGLILALLFEIAHNIIPLIIFHFLFDTFAQLTSPAIIEQEVLVVSVLNMIYLAYGAYLIYVLLQRRKLNNQLNM